MKFSDWYRRAWTGFKLWWIPLCAVAFIFVAVQMTPQILIKNDPTATELSAELEAVIAAARQQQQRRVNFHMRRAQLRLKELGYRAMELLLYVGPIIGVIGALLIILGMGASTKDGVNLKRDSARTGRRGLSVILTQFIGTFLFILPVTFSITLPVVIIHFTQPEPSTRVFLLLGFGLFAILCIPLCMGLYIAFFFAPQLAADESLNPFRALRRSVQLVKLAPASVALLAFCNGTLQTLSGFTVIGLVPVTAFANTARGAAYYSLLDEEKRRAGEAVAVSVSPKESEDPAPESSEPEKNDADAQEK